MFGRVDQKGQPNMRALKIDLITISKQASFKSILTYKVLVSILTLSIINNFDNRNSKEVTFTVIHTTLCTNLKLNSL